MELKKIKGIYLVIDPKREHRKLLRQLVLALDGGVNVVQIWNQWNTNVIINEKEDFIKNIKTICIKYNVPVIMHEDWQLSRKCKLDGIHFDEIPPNFKEIKNLLPNKIIGLTVGNELNKIRWAQEQKINYISFCSIFPSSSVNSCEIVKLENIKAAKSITNMSIFLSGGILPNNISKLIGLEFDGIAVISGILDAKNPTSVVKSYQLQLKNI